MLEIIPSRFEMLGHTIHVVWVDKLTDDETGADNWGESDYSANIIRLERPGAGVDPEILHQTFWHEWMHFARHYVVQDITVDEETFADLMGAAMHQYHRTAVFAAPARKRKPARKTTKKR